MKTLSEIEIKQRLAARSKLMPSGCIEWQKGRQQRGYGMCYWLGRKRLTHRLSYEAHNGPIPPHLFVLHKCDNPPCLNPDHLFLGTALDNRRDQIAKRRDPTMEAKHCIRGHEYTEKNTTTQSNGRRRCRACNDFNMKRWAKTNRSKADDPLKCDSQTHFNGCECSMQSTYDRGRIIERRNIIDWLMSEEAILFGRTPEDKPINGGWGPTTMAGSAWANAIRNKFGAVE